MVHVSHSERTKPFPRNPRIVCPYWVIYLSACRRRLPSSLSHRTSIQSLNVRYHEPFETNIMHEYRGWTTLLPLELPVLKPYIRICVVLCLPCMYFARTWQTLHHMRTLYSPTLTIIIEYLSLNLATLLRPMHLLCEYDAFVHSVRGSTNRFSNSASAVNNSWDEDKFGFNGRS